MVCGYVMDHVHTHTHAHTHTLTHDQRSPTPLPKHIHTCSPAIDWPGAGWHHNIPIWRNHTGELAGLVLWKSPYFGYGRFGEFIWEVWNSLHSWVNYVEWVWTDKAYQVVIDTFSHPAMEDDSIWLELWGRVHGCYAAQYHNLSYSPLSLSLSLSLSPSPM